MFEFSINELLAIIIALQIYTIYTIEKIREN